MYKKIALIFILLVSFNISFAKGNVPQFKHYRVHQIYTGKNHPLKLDSFSKPFRTRLRAAIKHNKPSFAGKYIVVNWGCGTAGCNTGAIIDATTGKAYSLPTVLFSVYPIKAKFEAKGEGGQEHIYRKNSRLMIFAGNMSSGTRRGSTGTDVIKFYKFSHGKFVLLKTLPYGRAK